MSKQNKVFAKDFIKASKVAQVGNPAEDNNFLTTYKNWQTWTPVAGLGDDAIINVFGNAYSLVNDTVTLNIGMTITYDTLGAGSIFLSNLPGFPLFEGNDGTSEETYYGMARVEGNATFSFVSLIIDTSVKPVVLEIRPPAPFVLNDGDNYTFNGRITYQIL